MADLEDISWRDGYQVGWRACGSGDPSRVGNSGRSSKRSGSA